MPCYKEFLEQVKSISSDFITLNKLSLAEIKDDDYVRFSDNEWNVVFLCEYGRIEVTLISIKDGFQYNLCSVFENLNPNSSFVKEFENNVWSSEKSIIFWNQLLKEFFFYFRNEYENLKDELSEHKKRSFILIDFVFKKGSESLKSEFCWNNDKWIELASEEYIEEKAKANKE